MLVRRPLAHPLGTDELGRDILSRLLWGARITLLMTVGAVVLALVTGAFLGIVAGFRGGWVDTAIMRCMDVLLAIPTFLLAIAIIAALGAGTTNVILAVGIGSMPAFARIARGSTISVKQEDYVMAVRAVGAIQQPDHVAAYPAECGICSARADDFAARHGDLDCVRA